MARRTVTFTREERARLAEICKVLGIRFDEFVHRATMHALDEMEGDERYRKMLWDQLIVDSPDEDRPCNCGAVTIPKGVRCVIIGSDIHNPLGVPCMRSTLVVKVR